MHLKLIGLWTCLVLACAGCRSGGPNAPELLELTPYDRVGSGAPALTQVEMQTLVREVRDELEADPLFPWPKRKIDIPTQVADRPCRAHVSIRDRGVLLAHGESPYVPLGKAFPQALRDVCDNIQAQRHSLAGRWDHLAVECELTGPAEHVPLSGAGQLPFEAYFEIGIHGYGLLSHNQWAELRPSQVVSGGWASRRNASLAVAADLMSRVPGTAETQPEQVRVFRFRSAHWWQPFAGEACIPLLRGLMPATQDVVDPRHMDETIHDLGEYLLLRQKSEGLFSYEYRVCEDEYSEVENWVRQAGASWALAAYADFCGLGAVAEAAQRAADAWARLLAPVEGESFAAFINTSTGKNKLGTSAIVLILLTEPRLAPRYTPVRERLSEGLLSQQQADGSFLPNFPPAQQQGSQYYYPGQAMLALARQYGLTKEPRLAYAFEKGHAFYADFFRTSGTPAFVPWHVQAHALMYEHTGRQEYADFALEMSDWLAPLSIDETETPWPDLVGGFANNQAAAASISTASYLEGYADALALARRLGDKKRAEHYEQIIRSAARFIARLIVKPDETVFHVRPDQSVHGVRGALYDNHLRIDHVQHALVSLIKSREVLFGKPGDAGHRN